MCINKDISNFWHSQLEAPKLHFSKWERGYYIYPTFEWISEKNREIFTFITIIKGLFLRSQFGEGGPFKNSNFEKAKKSGTEESMTLSNYPVKIKQISVLF